MVVSHLGHWQPYIVSCKSQCFIFLCLFFNNLILHSNPSSPHLPTTLIDSSERLRSPMGSQQSLSQHFEVGPRPSPLHLGWARYTSIGNRLQRASSCTTDKYWIHCQWPTNCPRHNCHPRSEGLDGSYAGSPAASPESVSSHLHGVSCFWGFPSMVLAPLRAGFLTTWPLLHSLHCFNKGNK